LQAAGKLQGTEVESKIGGTAGQRAFGGYSGLPINAE
jgi:hypothetical protein